MNGSVPSKPTDPYMRLRVVVRGAVQGVGFRPFLFRLATRLQLSGWVNNTLQGVVVEVEGPQRRLDEFLLHIQGQAPPLARIEAITVSRHPPAGFPSFEIRASDTAGPGRLDVLPDVASCADCLAEVFDPADRRYLYPFTNCTQCGPRLSISERLPYDRVNTTMRHFPLCETCRREYQDPADRRFHAQPNACPTCGPQLALWDAQGRVLARHHPALLGAGEGLRRGEILALKSLGGFHLLADARNEAAIRRLRARKHRPAKPLAVMFPSLEGLAEVCVINAEEYGLLSSPQAPIVLLRRSASANPLIAPALAPDNPYLGAMLPYTPLHHILLRELGFPVVATSGNLSDEPICIDEREALSRLEGIADRFLVHNRPIAWPVDDSVVQVALGRAMWLRVGRGCAPLSLPLAGNAAPAVLAVGAQQKNTVAIATGDRLILSQPIGDLQSAPTFAVFQRTIEGLETLYGAPRRVACDAHPDYLASQYARDTRLPVTIVQHHHAHVAACLAEHGLTGAVLGVAWDGTGLGEDGTLWGGEFLRCTRRGYQRVGYLRRFRLPGGEQAVREPRRAALGLLHELFGEDFATSGAAPLHTFSPQELTVLRQMLRKGIHCPPTSSAGRLFDAVASLLGLQQFAGFEGQAAMALQFAAEAGNTEDGYPVELARREGDIVVDWGPMLQVLLGDIGRGVTLARIAARFHNFLAESILAVVKALGEPRIVLTGGCFQNRLLLEHTATRLQGAGLQVYWPQRVPPNDAGIALGQAAVACVPAEEDILCV